VKGRFLYVTNWLVSQFSLLLRAILQRAKMVDQVKKLWRQRLAGGDEEEALPPAAGK
jgi:hypothetical protein